MNCNGFLHAMPVVHQIEGRNEGTLVKSASAGDLSAVVAQCSSYYACCFAGSVRACRFCPALEGERKPPDAVAAHASYIIKAHPARWRFMCQRALCIVCVRRRGCRTHCAAPAPLTTLAAGFP